MKTFNVKTRYDDNSKKLSKIIIDRLLNQGYKIDEKNPETVFVIGGDGTFLRAVAEDIDNLDKVNFYGIHTGTLGFFTDYMSCEIDEFIDNFINLKPSLKTYQVLEICVDNKDCYYAVNEMRIENAVRTQKIDIVVDGNEFETFRGTGICISTQLGSSAYNRSLGSAILYDGLDLLELSEIAGIHHASYRSLGVPIVLSDKSIIDLSSDNFDNALLCYDAFSINIDGASSVKVKLSDKKVRMLKYKEICYFNKLKSLF